MPIISLLSFYNIFFLQSRFQSGIIHCCQLPCKRFFEVMCLYSTNLFYREIFDIISQNESLLFINMTIFLCFLIIKISSYTSVWDKELRIFYKDFVSRFKKFKPREKEKVCLLLNFSLWQPMIFFLSFFRMSYKNNQTMCSLLSLNIIHLRLIYIVIWISSSSWSELHSIQFWIFDTFRSLVCHHFPWMVSCVLERNSLFFVIGFYI